MGLLIQLSHLWSDARGGVGKLFSLTLPLLLLAGAPAVELTEQVWENNRLQSIAEGAALAAARDLSLNKREPGHIEKTVQDFVSESRRKVGSTSKIDVKTTLVDGAAGVTVVLSKEWQSPISGLLGAGKSNAYGVATAHIVGNTKVCALSLMDSGNEPGLQLDDEAQVSASDCGIYSNAEGSNSIQASIGSKLTAYLICASGGVSAGATDNFSPGPMADCTQMKDPLAHVAAPAAGPCMESNLVVDDSTVLFPGTYCGGLTIRKNAWVGLQPGVYVIKDGPLKIEDTAEVAGKEVAFHMSGEDAVFSLGKDTKISLGAPKNGPLKGLLFYEAAAERIEKQGAPVTTSLMAVLNISMPARRHGSLSKRTHRISSSGARELVGTIYLPKSSLLIDAAGPVADKSAFTAIVTRSLNLRSGPHLVLNTNYGATDVPVPRSIAGGDVRLTE